MELSDIVFGVVLLILLVVIELLVAVIHAKSEFTEVERQLNEERGRR